MGAEELKKYWKLLVMSIVIIFAISVHYMQLAKAIQLEDVKFSIETVSGDETELDSLVLQASYYDEYISKSVYISQDEGQEKSESYMNSELFVMYQPLLFEQYIKDYRSFMRGKEYILSNYVEDEERLAHVKTPNISTTIAKGEPLTFKIDILTKSTKERATFEVQALAKEHYNWQQIEDVYMADGELKLFVEGSTIDGKADLQLYTIDEQTKQITDVQTLSETGATNNRFSNISLYSDPRSVSNESYHVYQQKSWTFNETTGREEEIVGDYYVYSLLTDENELLPTAELENIQTVFQQGNNAYVVTEGTSELTLHTYQLQEKAWEKPVTVSLSTFISPELDSAPYIQVKDEKLYVANPIGNTNELFIYDLATQELLYKGVVKGEGINSRAEILIEQIF